jgi:hypothetical protein
MRLYSIHTEGPRMARMMGSLGSPSMVWLEFMAFRQSAFFALLTQE